jgi:hypothetical protein
MDSERTGGKKKSARALTRKDDRYDRMAKRWQYNRSSTIDIKKREERITRDMQVCGANVLGGVFPF